MNRLNIPACVFIYADCKTSFIDPAHQGLVSGSLSLTVDDLWCGDRMKETLDGRVLFIWLIQIIGFSSTRLEGLSVG